MFTVVIILIIIVCLLLTLVVLVQNPKGGGLGATFGGFSSSVLGAQRTTDILEKATWTLAMVLIGFSLLSKFFIQQDVVISDQSTSQLDINPGLGGAPPSTEDNTAWPFGGPID